MKTSNIEYHDIQYAAERTINHEFINSLLLIKKIYNFYLGTKQLSKMTVFNDQAYIQIGGQWNENLRRVDRPYRGVIAGLTFNGLRPLELAGDSDPKATVTGDSRKLNNIPFDYKEQHSELFTKDAIKLMIDQIYDQKNHGATPVQNGKYTI